MGVLLLIDMAWGILCTFAWPFSLALRSIGLACFARPSLITWFVREHCQKLVFHELACIRRENLLLSSHHHH